MAVIEVLVLSFVDLHFYINRRNVDYVPDGLRTMVILTQWIIQKYSVKA